ncbi:MAG: cyclic nucleotide-binding domain-containing protein [Gammaproteobacteria bacterium]
MTETDLKQQYRAQMAELVPINSLSPQYQEQLLQRSALIELRKKKLLFNQGDRDDFSYYLLNGELELLANDQLNSTVTGGSDSSRYPLAQLQPRQFSARAKTPIVVLQVDRHALDKLLVFERESAGNTDDLTVTEIGAHDDSDWMTRMLQSELFSRLPTANIHQLFATLEPVEFNRDAIVVAQDDPGDYYYIIQEGQCEVLRRSSPTNSMVKLAELKAGDSFGEEALLSGATRNATVRMLTSGVLMRLTKSQFLELIKKPVLESVDYASACERVSAGAKWLDVRLPEEFAQTHIENSLNLPLSELRSRPDQLDADQDYIVCCDSGGRSSVAAFLLTDKSYRVSYLDSGLMHCGAKLVEAAVPVEETAKPATAEKPAAKPAQKSAQAEPEKTLAKPAEKLIEADVRASAYDAGLALNDMQISASRELLHEELDTAKRAAQEEVAKKLAEERAHLQAAQQKAAAEAEQKRLQEEARIKALREQTERELREQKKKLEAVYARNNAEMERLNKLKQEAEQQIQQARAQAEAESQTARQRMQEADQVKQQYEQARKTIEENASRHQHDQAALEQKVQAEAKRKLEAERRRLAEQFQRSNAALAEAQQERAAAEAARLAAGEEAQRIIAEYKTEHERIRAEEQARLQAERDNLEAEAKRIRETLESVDKSREDAEAARQAAEMQVAKLKIKLAHKPEQAAAELSTKIEDAQQAAEQARRNLAEVEQVKQQAEVARKANVDNLARQSEEEKLLRQQIEDEVSSWLSDNELQQPSEQELQKQTEYMQRIKSRAEQAKKAAQSAAQDLMQDIATQLGKD